MQQNFGIHFSCITEKTIYELRTKQNKQLEKVRRPIAIKNPHHPQVVEYKALIRMRLCWENNIDQCAARFQPMAYKIDE